MRDRTAAAARPGVAPRLAWQIGLPLLGGLAASLMLARMIRPWVVGSVGFDSAASVIHFDRIVAGLRLEAFVTATPKPLLTLLYGATHGLIPDWRAIGFESILALALAITLAGVLVARVVPGCPRPIAVGASTLALLGSSQLAVDAGLSYAVGWACLSWLVAILAADARPARPWLVGAGLLAATLARLESVVVIGVIGLAFAVQLVRERRGRPPGPWSARRIAVAGGIAALALPVMLVHDWLLTGDPLFWLRVSAVYSANTASLPSPAQVARAVVAVASARPLLAMAALIGVAALWRGRRVETLAGLAALGPILGVVLVALAARGTYVSGRYYAGIEVALLIAAAIGLSRAAEWLTARIAGWLGVRAGRSGSRLVGASLAAVGVVAVVLASPFAPLDRSVASKLTGQRELALVGDRSLAAIRHLLASDHPTAGQAAPPGAAPLVVVPTLLRPRLALDLDLPLWAVSGLNERVIAPDGSGVRVGQVVLHAARFDRPADAYGALEGGDSRLGPYSLTLEATFAGPAWVFQIR